MFRKNAPKQTRSVLTVECDSSKAPSSGPDVSPEDWYAHPPRTSFQKECRRKETKDLQHFTRAFKSQVVERSETTKSTTIPRSAT